MLCTQSLLEMDKNVNKSTISNSWDQAKPNYIYQPINLTCSNEISLDHCTDDENNELENAYDDDKEEEEDEEEENEENDENDDDPNQTSTSTNLDDFAYRELTSDVTSSVSFLSRRITRQYASEFVLPDDTRVAVQRCEINNPIDHMEFVILNISVGFSENQIDSRKESSLSDDVKTLDKIPQSQSSTESAIDCEYGQTKVNNSKNSSYSLNCTGTLPSLDFRGLQISDYIEDDLWAATLLLCDHRSNADLLKQLEFGCRLEPDAYRMERVQTRKNRETVIDFLNTPVVRTIDISRNSDTDSIDTTLTDIGVD